MKWAIALIGAMSLMLGGCANELKPAPGMSALRVKVAAEPKKGLESSHVAVYDSGTTDVGSGAFERVDYSDLGDIVVWLEAADTGLTFAPKSTVAIDLNAARAANGISAAAVGQKVVFRNTGDKSLVAYSVSDGNTFSLGNLAPGQQVERMIASAGLIEIITDSSAAPIANVFVARTMNIVVTHSGATVDFNNLQPGYYRVCSWHPRLPGSTLDVQLAPDQGKTVTIGVTVNSLPKIESK